MSAPVFRPAVLPGDRALLIDLNTEYLSWVLESLRPVQAFDIADVFAEGSVRGYITGVIDKIIGPGAPASAFYIIEVDGAVAGMGGLRTVRPGVAELKRIYVREACRGLGLGRAIVERLMNDARRFGFADIYLDTAPTLTAARALYARLGFTDIPLYAEVEVPALFHPIWVFMGRSLA